MNTFLHKKLSYTAFDLHFNQSLWFIAYNERIGCLNVFK